MPEDVKKEGTQAGPEPEFTIEQLGTALKGTIQEALAEQFAKVPHDRDPYRESRSEPSTDQREPENPLMAALAPMLAPAFKRLGMSSASAEDAAVFYSSTPRAVQHREEIEKITKSLHDQGIPFAREAIWDWYKGKNMEKFMKEAHEEQEVAAKAALIASGVGVGAPNLTPELSAILSSGKSAHELSDEELDLLIKGKGGAVPANF